MNHIIQYFYLDYHNNRYGVNEKRFNKRNEYYFRCIVNFYYSCIENFKNDDYKLYFVCNDTENIEFIPNFSFKEFLLKNNITIINKKSKYVPKEQIWAGSMYLFDAIEAVLQVYKDNINFEDNFIFFDNDVLFNSPLNEIKILYDKWDIMVYDISHEYIKGNKWVVNFNNIDNKYLDDNDFKPYGGEFLAIKGSYIKNFFDEFLKVYPQDGLITEEHYISYLVSYRLSNCKIKLINNYLKRIWSTYRYSNLEDGDYNLNILHLPSEKEYGLYFLNKYLIKSRKYDKNKVLRYIGLKERYLHLKIIILVKKIIKRAKTLLRE